MIKIFILVILWSDPYIASDNSRAITKMEFTSLAKCQAASYTISKETFKKYQSSPVMICAEK